MKTTYQTGYQLGHPRLGGRKPGSLNRRTRLAIEICEQMGFHPAAFLATIAYTGFMPNADGSTTPVTPDDRLKAATALAPFVMPKLATTQTEVTRGDGDRCEPIDVTPLLENEDLAAHAQELALGLVKADSQRQGREEARIETDHTGT